MNLLSLFWTWAKVHLNHFNSSELATVQHSGASWLKIHPCYVHRVQNVTLLQNHLQICITFYKVYTTSTKVNWNETISMFNTTSIFSPVPRNIYSNQISTMFQRPITHNLEILQKLNLFIQKQTTHHYWLLMQSDSSILLIYERICNVPWNFKFMCLHNCSAESIDISYKATYT